MITLIILIFLKGRYLFSYQVLILELNIILKKFQYSFMYIYILSYNDIQDSYNFKIHFLNSTEKQKQGTKVRYLHRKTGRRHNELKENSEILATI